MKLSLKHIYYAIATNVFLFCNCSNFYTQFLEFTATVDQNNISSDDYIRYTIQTNQKISINKTGFSQFNVIQGPFTSSSSSVSIINGKVDKKEKYTFSYIIAPTKTGQLTIGPASTNYNGKNYSTNPIVINVSEGNQPINGKKDEREDRSTLKNTGNLFARINLNKSKVFKGESVLATYKIYTRYNSMQITNYDFPLKEGLWVDELKSNGNGWPQKREIINGMAYNVLTLKKEIAIPQTIGEIKFPAIKLDAVVNQSMFGWGSEVTFKSNSPTLEVLPIPKNGKPNEFNGQVGSNYDLDVFISSSEINIDEPLDISIKINGNGNINHLELPEIAFPSIFEIYPPEENENIKITSNGIKGSKEINYILIPRHYGTYVIPEINFSYYDPKKKKYVQLNHPAKEINVLKNGQVMNNQDQAINQTDLNSSNSAQKIKILNKDIRHIENESIIKEKKALFYGTFNYWFLLILPLILLSLFIFIYRYKVNNTDHDLIKRRGAGKKLEKKFALAEKHLKSQDQQSFYDELYKSWINYISLKFKLPVAELNKETIEHSLEKHAIGKEDIHELGDILKECEMAQYAPLKQENAHQTLEKSKLLISKIEKHVKI